MEPASAVGLFDVAPGDYVPPAASSLAKRMLRFTNNAAYLDLLPGNFDLVKFSLIAEKTKLDIARDRFLRFVSAARTEYDLIVIDCNPSSSFITLCALHACGKLLVPVRPDRYSVLGLELVSDFLQRVPTIHPKPEITILLNGIPTRGYDKTTEDELRAHSKFGALVLTHRLRQSKLLLATGNYTGFATDKRVSYRSLLTTEIREIVDEMASRWGL
jgi:chromosome partitioning protein